MRSAYYDYSGEAINFRSSRGIVGGKVEDDGPGWLPPLRMSTRCLFTGSERKLSRADTRAMRAVWREYGGYREGRHSRGGLSLDALADVWGTTSQTARKVVHRRGDFAKHNR